MLMGAICVTVLLLGLCETIEIVYSNRRSKRKNSFNKGDLEKIKMLINLSNKGGTLDHADFYDIPYSKFRIKRLIDVPNDVSNNEDTLDHVDFYDIPYCKLGI